MKKKNSELTFLEKGEVLDEMSLDFILGGQGITEESGGCNHCNTCSSGGNNSPTPPRQQGGAGELSVG